MWDELWCYHVGKGEDTDVGNSTAANLSNINFSIFSFERGHLNQIILYDVPVNSHFAGVWFSEFLSGDDLEEAEQLAAVREVGEEVVDLHLGLQQEAVHPFCESLLLDV